MKLKVTEHGVTIPKRMLNDAEEVEVRRENGRIVIDPAVAEDPIMGLGTDPVECGASDASVEHDHYLYGSGA